MGRFHGVPSRTALCAIRFVRSPDIEQKDPLTACDDPGQVDLDYKPPPTRIDRIQFVPLTIAAQVDKVSGAEARRAAAETEAANELRNSPPDEPGLVCAEYPFSAFAATANSPHTIENHRAVADIARRIRCGIEYLRLQPLLVQERHDFSDHDLRFPLSRFASCPNGGK